jgi:hypothetical protein
MSGLRRNMMAASRGGGSAIDWESMLRQAISGVGDIDEFVFPSGTTQLRQYGLYNANYKTIIIPDSVQINRSREYSFAAYNTQLTRIEFGSGLTRIDETFCRGCTALSSVTIPSQITSVGYFAFQGCTALAEVICLPTTPPSVAQSFNGCTALAAIYVPDDSVATYKATNGWSSYASIIKGISERPTT